MKISITPTTEIVECDGVRCRIWRGVTSRGTECVLLVHRVIMSTEDSAEFKELEEQFPPSRFIGG